MTKSFLQRLESAFEEASALPGREAQAEYLTHLSKCDPVLAQELQLLLQLQGEAEEFFESPQSEYASLLSTTLGDTKRGETIEDFLAFLREVSTSSGSEEIAHARGFSFRELIATGPSGFLFRGWDSHLRRMVAIKVLAFSIARNAERRKLFVDEARLASSVTHPNVVPIYHISAEPESNLVFYVMEWISGMTLQNWLDRQSTHMIDEATSIRWVRQLCQGLDAIHSRGIVHRDLKPANVLLEASTNELKIVDFGIAFESAKWSDCNLPAGTPLFMSPEQLRCDRLTNRSDLFALAEIACLLTYGVHPFTEKSIEELSSRVLRGEPSLPTPQDGCAPATQAVLRKALSVDPAARFGDANEFCSAFTASLAVRPASGIQSPETETANRTTLENHESLSSRESARQFGLAQRIPTKALLAVIGVALIALMIIGVRVIDPSVGTDAVDRRDLDAVAVQDAASKPVQGIWDGDRFVHPLGLRLRLVPAAKELIETWPPDPARPELFENLGWQNMERAQLIGEHLVTVSQYRDVMGPDTVAVELRDDQPVTNVSYDDVLEFCRRLNERDVDGLSYVPCSKNGWTLATYGIPMLDDQLTSASVLQMLDDLSQGKSEDDRGLLVGDVFGPYWEWTSTRFTKPVTLDGVVSYRQRPEVPNEPLQVLVGGASSPLFVHFHDTNYGMNDHFQDSHNLKWHIETDGETSYLAPEVTGEKAWVSYRYRFTNPVITASVQAPFQLYQSGSSGGIRLRFRTPSTFEPLDNCRWHSIVEYEAPFFFNAGEKIDLSTTLKDAIEIELQYWIESPTEPTWEVQLGRTSRALAVPSVFGFEAVTESPNDWYRKPIAAPRQYKSPLLGFRIEAIMKGDIGPNGSTIPKEALTNRSQ